MKVIGTKYGIDITRPWSNEMYEHNDKVAHLMKAEILIRLKEIHKNRDEEALRDLAKVVYPCGYGTGFDFDGIYEDTLQNIEDVQNYWLHEEFPYGVKKGIVSDIGIEFIGY